MRRSLPALALVATLLVGALSGAAPAQAGASGSLFGASVAARSGETFPGAVARQDAAYGTPTPMPISRVFYPTGPKPWPASAGASKRPVVVSFKYLPKDVIAGTYDSALSTFFAGAPSSYDVFWSYIHEPEDEIAAGDFSLVDYRTAWQRVADLARAAAPANLHLRSTLILTCYTMSSASGRNWSDYYLPSAQSMLSFDCYNHVSSKGLYGDPANIFKAVTAWSDLYPTIAWGVSEVGSTLATTDPSGTGRAAWLRSLGRFLSGQHAARSTSVVYGLYFDSAGPVGTDYRLLDTASMAAWREVVQTY